MLMPASACTHTFSHFLDQRNIICTGGCSCKFIALSFKVAFVSGVIMLSYLGLCLLAATLTWQSFLILVRHGPYIA